MLRKSEISIVRFYLLFMLCEAKEPWDIHSVSGETDYTDKNEVVRILKERGFKVLEMPGERPLAFVGDIAYEPSQILSKSTTGRATTVTKRLWKDSDGKPLLRYFFDNQTKGGKEVFLQAKKNWLERTCLRVEEMEPFPCNGTGLPHPAACVGDFGNCFSRLGMESHEDGSPQKLSIQPDCTEYAATHEFGHTMGFQHHQCRPDRDEYITFNVNLIGISLEWGIDTINSRRRFLAYQSTRCDKDQVMDLPVPYDFLSIMHYITTVYSDAESRPTLVAKDGHFVYLPEYRALADLLISHYDLFTINSVYGCVKTWQKECSANGNDAPKCKNAGYLGKDCKCHCADGFGGAACETKTGPIYPIQPGAYQVPDVTETKLIDMNDIKMTPGKIETALIILVASGKDNNTQVSITLERSLGIIETLLRFKKTIPSEDEYMLSLYWGIAAEGKLRAEMISSIANNDTEGPRLHSKTNQLDLWAYAVRRSAADCIKLVRFRFSVEFVPRPGALLSVQKKNPGELAIAAARMVAQAGGAAGLAAGGVGLLLLLLLAAFAGLVLHRRRLKRIEAEEAASGSSGSQDDEEGEEENSTEEETKSNEGKVDADEKTGEDKQEKEEKEETGETKEKEGESDAKPAQDQGTIFGLPSLW